MRSYSFFKIIILCLAIFLVDILSFYWLQSITRLIEQANLRFAIHLLFWFFSIGLITSIIILKIRLDFIGPYRKQVLISSLYGLTISSFLPKIVFILVITFAFFTNYVFSKEESLILIPVIGLFSGFLPFLVIAYAVFKAVYRFKVHTVSIKSKLLPKQFNGLRIVQISDIHLGSFNFRYPILERAVKMINELDADLIFFTGDLVNNYAWELRGWDKIFQELQAKMGKYAVLGNHDYGDYSTWKTPKKKKANFELITHFFKKIDFKLLKNDSDIIEISNEKIAIIGVENWGNPPFKQYGNLDAAMQNVQYIKFKILLSHDPSHWSEEVQNKTDIVLTLSGHTHGMQAGINLKNKQWSPIQYKYKHWIGLHEENNQFLYVNKGLGWMGFPGRLGMRPEITLFILEN